MPLETALVWASLLYSAFMLVRPGNRLLRAKAASLILVSAVCVIFDPLDAGGVACLGAFCLIVVPLQLSRLAANEIAAGRPKLLLCYLAYGAHPDAVTWAQIGTAQAVRLSASRARAEAIAAWNRLAQSETVAARRRAVRLAAATPLGGSGRAVSERDRLGTREICPGHDGAIVGAVGVGKGGGVGRRVVGTGRPVRGWQAARLRAVACAAVFAATGRVAALEHVLAAALSGQRARVGELYLLQAQLAAGGASPGVTATLARPASARDQDVAARAGCILAHARAAVALSPAQAGVVEAAIVDSDARWHAKPKSGHGSPGRA